MPDIKTKAIFDQILSKREQESDQAFGVLVVIVTMALSASKTIEYLLV